jgi:hypothetical protein
MTNEASQFEEVSRDIKHDQKAKASWCPGCTRGFIAVSDRIGKANINFVQNKLVFI